MCLPSKQKKGVQVSHLAPVFVSVIYLGVTGVSIGAALEAGKGECKSRLLDHGLVVELADTYVLETYARACRCKSCQGYQFRRGGLCILRWSFDSNVVKYRIGIINDFKNTTTVVDYQKYGIMQSLQAWEVGVNHRGYQLKEDAIWIFCNFQKVAVVRSRSEAVSVLNKLIQSCPPESKSDFEEYKEILFRHMRD